MKKNIKIYNLIEHKLRLLKHVILFPENEIKWLKSLNRTFNVSIDIGANRGYMSYILSKKSKKVISIEPIDYLAVYLKNVLPLNCNIINAAASNHSGVAKIKIPIDKNEKDITALSSVDSGNTFEGSNEVCSFREMIVDKITLDGLLCDLPKEQKVEFIKIDVEGHEESLLEGAKKSIKLFKPIVQIEIEERHGADILGIFDYFFKEGYSSYIVNGENLVRCTPLEFLEMQKSSKVNSNRYISDVIFMPK